MRIQGGLDNDNRACQGLRDQLVDLTRVAERGPAAITVGVPVAQIPQEYDTSARLAISRPQLLTGR